jgi:hypothetical protein
VTSNGKLLWFSRELVLSGHKSFGVKERLSESDDALGSAMNRISCSLRRITCEKLSHVDHRSIFHVSAICRLAALIHREGASWLHSRYANEVNDKNQQKKAIYMLLC